jgi:hypothetical protein
MDLGGGDQQELPAVLYAVRSLQGGYNKCTCTPLTLINRHSHRSGYILIVWFTLHKGPAIYQKNGRSLFVYLSFWNNELQIAAVIRHDRDSRNRVSIVAFV